MIDDYKNIFDGGSFLRNGKMITLKDYAAFDGGASQKIIPILMSELEKIEGPVTVLDYGCGTSIQWHTKIYSDRTKTLPELIGSKLQGFYRYDPAVRLYSKQPETKFDIITCTDVMEHIDDSEIDDFFDNLNKFVHEDSKVFFSISTKLSLNSFADGVNMHVNIKSEEYWKSLIEQKLKTKHLFIIFPNTETDFMSSEYKKIMEKEYNNKSFGGAVIKKIDFILKYLKSKDDIETILDYGCGPGLFKKHMTRMNEPYEIFEYEPGDPKKDFINGPKDCTICIDVMEHVEENYVDSVIKNIADHTKKYALFSIALNPAKKHLPDGRNAHITLKSHDWWLKKIKKHFSDVRYNPNPKIIERTLNVYCTK